MLLIKRYSLIFAANLIYECFPEKEIDTSIPFLNKRLRNLLVTNGIFSSASVGSMGSTNWLVTVILMGYKQRYLVYYDSNKKTGIKLV